MSTVGECRLVPLRKIERNEGALSVVEGGADVPFSIARVYYLYDVPGGESRGGHAHKQLQQLIVSAMGSFDVTLDDGASKRTFTLNRAYQGLYMPAGIWRELDNFSSGAICLVLASEVYDEADYLRTYDEFLAWKGLRGPASGVDKNSRPGD